MNRLAIIGSGRMAWIIGKNAHEMDIKTYCFSNVDSSFIHESIDVFNNISIFEKDKIVEQCKEYGINGVIATTELTVPVAAYVAECLHLSGLSYQISQVITDKYRNRVACKSVAGLCQPYFEEFVDREELRKGDFKYPLIVKPTSKGGKQGITVVNCIDELLAAFDYAKEKSHDDPVIVEEYISGGQEYSVESLSYQGKHYVIQVTEKISSGPPHCVELGHHQPADLSVEMRKKVEDVVILGLKAVGVDNSSCHTEIKIVDGKIYLIEFNCRPGGDHIAWPLTFLSTGYNYIKGAIQIALDTFVEVDYSKFDRKYAGVFFVTKQSAYLKPVFDKCEQFDWLYHKNHISDELLSLEHNDCYGTNSMIYLSKKERPHIENYLHNT